MVNDKIISECTCRGLNLLEKLSSYYMDRFEGVFSGVFSESPKNRTKQYEDAKKLSNDVFNILTDKGVKYKDDLPPIESFKKDINIKLELEACNSYNDRSCVTLLEMLMGKLHQSPEAQNKLICGHQDRYRKDIPHMPYLEQNNVDMFLSDIFRGEFYKEGKDYYEIQYNPFNEYFHEKHRDACKKYKK